MAAESLQRDLDSERQKSMRLEEDKAHLENGRKEHDRIKAQVTSCMKININLFGLFKLFHVSFCVMNTIPSGVWEAFQFVCIVQDCFDFF